MSQPVVHVAGDKVLYYGEQTTIAMALMLCFLRRADKVDALLADQINRMEEQNRLTKDANAILNKIRLQRPIDGNEAAPTLTDEEIATLKRIGIDFDDPNGDGDTSDSLYVVDQTAWRVYQIDAEGRQVGEAEIVHVPLKADGLPYQNAFQKAADKFRETHPDARNVMALEAGTKVLKPLKTSDYEAMYVNPVQGAIDSLNTDSQLESIRLNSLNDKSSIAYKFANSSPEQSFAVLREIAQFLSGR